MKKIKLINAVLALFVAVSFTSCDEEGTDVQFQVVDEFETNANVTGLGTSTTFSVDQSTDVSDLLENADEFVEAQIEEVTLLLNDDYSGETISGSFSLEAGAININETLTLTKTAGSTITIPENASSILNDIQSGSFSFKFSGNLDEPAGDDDFSLNMKFKIKATVQ